MKLHEKANDDFQVYFRKALFDTFPNLPKNLMAGIIHKVSEVAAKAIHRVLTKKYPKAILVTSEPLTEHVVYDCLKCSFHGLKMGYDYCPICGSRLTWKNQMLVNAVMPRARLAVKK